MAHIAKLLQAGRTFSFEFFPPRTEEAAATLERTLLELEPLHPSFVSVTYGAGGSTRERTHDLVVRINRETSMTAMAHLTCAAHTRDELAAILDRYDASGIENVLALGGDPPKDLDLPPGELEYAIELVRLARSTGGFSVGVAAHPEGHPRSPDLESDRDHLAEKLRESDFAITQFFFRASDYASMVRALRERGIDTPVIPGVMPVTNVSQVRRMAELSGAAFPSDLAERLTAVADRPEEVRRIGVEVATSLCGDLLEAGAPGLHFYTLNRSTATREIYERLGLAS